MSPASSGTLTVSGDVTAFGTLSDIRLKENLEVIPNALDKVSKINGVYYNWTFEAQEKHKHFGKEKEIGVIAQEVQSVLPSAVKEHAVLNGDGDYLIVEYDQLTALLIESIKELKAEIDDLKKNK